MEKGRWEGKGKGRAGRETGEPPPIPSQIPRSASVSNSISWASRGGCEITADTGATATENQ